MLISVGLMFVNIASQIECCFHCGIQHCIMDYDIIDLYSHMFQNFCELAQTQFYLSNKHAFERKYNLKLWLSEGTLSNIDIGHAWDMN